MAMGRRDAEGPFPQNTSNLAGEPNNKEIISTHRETERKRMESGKMYYRK